MSKYKDRTGETNINNQGLEMRIIECRSAIDIDVEFENKYIAKNKRYERFKNGSINNPYYQSVYGVGYIGEGKYNTGIHNKHTIEYKIWNAILQRCYNEKRQKEFPTYKNCITCEEWLCYQNFAEWFNNNYYEVENEKIHVDKDILIKGNKIYSPEFCILVPERINILFVKCDKSRGEYPIGVCYHKNAEKFCVQLSTIKKHLHLGNFDTPEEAFLVYKQAKEKYIKEVADEYKDKIPQKLYDAMYNYIVEITD